MNNEKLLLNNSYLNIEEKLEKSYFYIKNKDYEILQMKNNNLIQLINDFFDIKNEKLQKYYDKPITGDFNSKFQNK
jgi:hypothetical protein